MLSASYQASRVARAKRGLTLVEMLVAMTCTILLMFAVTQTFQSIGEVSSRGRAAIEISTQLRGVRLRLQEDLKNLTVEVRPWPQAGAGEGYLSLYDGVSRDNTYQATSYNYVGDVDDVIGMTVRSSGEPFVGRYNGTMIQSQVAEVVWFTSFNNGTEQATVNTGTYDPSRPVTVHRRVLLVRPDLNNNNGDLGMPVGQLQQFLQQNDISVNVRGTNITANSLSDLSQRENRFGNSPTFPGPPNLTNGLLNSAYILAGDRLGEDVILTNVIGFDMRVFDRAAVVQTNGSEALAPGDPGYGGSGTSPIGVGAFVDLNHNTGTGEYTTTPVTKSGLQNYAIYDTWSYFYEHDGIDQFNDGLIDRATNGLDDDNANGVDDVGERETSPPYPVPLRGVQVRLRVIEPETRQVRQATVVQDFLPE
jgi:hypothetical protein